MPAGFQVLNDDGIFQIDDTTVCLALAAKGRTLANIHHPYGQGFGTCFYADVVYTGTATSIPIIAFRNVAAGILIGLLNVQRNGATWTFRIGVAGPTSSDFRFDWYIFDKPKPMASGAGLEIYLDSGELQFSTATPILAVKGPTGDGYPAGFYAVISPAGWNYREDLDTEDGQNFRYYWEYTFGGVTVTSTGAVGGERTVAAQSGTGASGLPNGIPTGYSGGMSLLIDASAL